MIPVLLGVSLIIFILFNLVSGDPTAVLLGKNATAKQMADLREQLGLNKSLWLQYLDVVKSAFTFDFGYSWSTKQEISKMILQGAYPSLCLSVPAFVISTVLSLLISLVVAYYRGKGIDLFIRVFCIAGMSISALAYILFFQWFFAFKLGWFEFSGFEAEFPFVISYIALPAIIWIVLSIGPDVRFFRTVILDEIYQDYVRTARAKRIARSHDSPTPCFKECSYSYHYLCCDSNSLTYFRRPFAGEFFQYSRFRWDDVECAKFFRFSSDEGDGDSFKRWLHYFWITFRYFIYVGRSKNKV
jgi:ABC-type dipeptide/oligopeptide/nickel transport system permease component